LDQRQVTSHLRTIVLRHSQKYLPCLCHQDVLVHSFKLALSWALCYTPGHRGIGDQMPILCEIKAHEEKCCPIGLLL
jgi:hypothetical protein